MSPFARVVVLGALLVSAGCGMEDTPAEQMTPPTLPPATTTSTTPSPSGEAVDFGEKGAFIASADDASKLAGTPADFQQFIVGQAGKLTRPDGADCEIGITVRKYDPAGFALGTVNECGGYVALWGKQNGSWTELLGTQDLWPCADLKENEVPPSLSETCADADTHAEVPYKG